MSPAKRKTLLKLLQPKYDALASEISDLEDELVELNHKHEAMDNVISALENDNDPDEDDWETASKDLPGFTVNPPNDSEKEVIDLLLEHASLSGGERVDLEAILEDDDLDPRRYSEIYQNHLHTIHQHQR